MVAGSVGMAPLPVNYGGGDPYQMPGHGPDGPRVTSLDVTVAATTDN
jgi:hypothetical protein